MCRENCADETNIISIPQSPALNNQNFCGTMKTLNETSGNEEHHHAHPPGCRNPDLSGFGRCSLTVAIPILSAMGLQCCPLPTAFLSTHTGGFEGFTFLDMTEEMPRVAAHWKSLDLRFQAIYSGFLGSVRQIDIVETFIRQFSREDTIVVVDPVMGDDGRAYRTYTPQMCTGMARLAGTGGVITPNLTEAAFLLNKPYEELPKDPRRVA